MIDFHGHIGNLAREGYPDLPPLSPEQLPHDPPIENR